MLTQTQASRPQSQSSYSLPYISFHKQPPWRKPNTDLNSVDQDSNNLTPWRLHVHPETHGGNRALQISPSAVVQARSPGTLPSSSFQIHSLLCVPAPFHPDYCQEPPHVSPTGSHLKAGQSFCYINLIISLLCLKSASASFSS